MENTIVKNLSEADKKTLGNEQVELLTKLTHVGNQLYKARQAHENIDEVITDLGKRDCGFTLVKKEEILDEEAEASPLLRELGVTQDMVADTRHTHKLRLKISGKKYDGIKIDGANNYREGRSNPTWSVCKSLTNEKGEITGAAIYVPAARMAYVANEQGAWSVELPRKEEDRKPRIHELKVSEKMKEPFLAEYGSWHRLTYSIPKAIFTSQVRESRWLHSRNGRQATGHGLGRHRRTRPDGNE